MGQHKYFGTDGIRGQVGSECINPEFVLKLGWAVGRVLSKGQRKKVIIGKDTRVSGYMLESALEAGLSAAGVDVYLLGPMPTPAIAYLTQTLRANAGIVISASHNLFQDNGIKFFQSEGIKLDDHIEQAIEAEIEKPLHTVSSVQLGKAVRIKDAAGRYIEFCKSTTPSLTRLNGLKIVVDCANGATYHIAPNVFKELGAEVISIADKPDGFNINRSCGSTFPKTLVKQVLEEKADVGIAFDGDGDRVIMVDSSGNIIDGDKILYIIAKDRHQKGRLHGGVVGTLMSNLGLEKSLESQNIPFIRTKVGDRYVMEALKANQWLIGGESSGHIVCLDKTTTGDGIIAALQVLTVMVQQEKGIDELCKDMLVYPQTLINLKTEKAQQLLEHTNVKQALAMVEAQLKHQGRVLLRASGTEPVLRVMIEGEDKQFIEDQATYLCETIMALDNTIS